MEPRGHGSSSSEEGSLTLLLGPMFAGKSTTLLKEYDNVGEERALLLVWDGDHRSRGHVTSHDGASRQATSVSSIMEARSLSQYEEKSFIFIDEGQFYPDLYDGVLAMVFQDARDVWVAGLSSDAKGRCFTNVCELLPCANHRLFLTGECSTPGCQCPSTHTFRHADPDGNLGQIQVGGSEMYAPLCTKCYLHASRR